jgi:hypothetical protein
MDDPQLAAVFDHPELSAKLTHDDKRPLSNFLYHLKNKKKALEGAQTQKIE